MWRWNSRPVCCDLLAKEAQKQRQLANDDNDMEKKDAGNKANDDANADVDANADDHDHDNDDDDDHDHDDDDDNAHLFWAEKSSHLVGCGDSVDVEKVQGGRGRCGRRLLQMTILMI